MSDSANRPIDLAPDYYLHNFRFLLDWVWERYADLLSNEEQVFVRQFNTLDHDAQCLLVRLSSRKGPLFRREKLAYSEITELDAAAQQLINAKLLQKDTTFSINVLANSLTKMELLALFSEQLAGLKQARKEILIQELEQQFNHHQSWHDWTNNQLGDAFYLDNQSIISNLLLLFFGNSYQNLTEFVLQDLGLFCYEKYPIDHQHRLFKNREELEQYQQLIKLREQLVECDSVDALIQVATRMPASCDNEKLKRRRAKLCNQIAYALERSGETAMAMQLYEQSHLSPARERRIRLLDKQQEFSSAWMLLNELLTKPQDEQELQIALRMAPRLAKKMGINFDKKTPSAINEKHLTLSQVHDNEGMPLRVEDVVLLSVNCEPEPCFYVENILLTGIFGLWLWPEMFRGIEGAFANPFQAAPLDMYQENFMAKRPEIAARLNAFNLDDFQNQLFQIWDEKFGITNHFVNWSLLDKNLLKLALACIPAGHLKVIFERFLFDIKNNCSGLPDLIQFYPEKQTYRMIEVKGPGDRIQDNQQRWLDYFAQHNIPAEVWYVRWQ